MRSSVSSLLLTASHKCQWNDAAQVVILCGHIATIIPNGNVEQISNATSTWIDDSGIPIRLAITSLCLMIDETEVAPGYNGKTFVDYLKTVVEASGVDSATITGDSEEKKPTVRKGRGRPKKAIGAAQQKFPAGTQKQSAKPVEKPVGKVVVTERTIDKVNVSYPIGCLDEQWCKVTKEWLSATEPLKDTNLGTVMIQRQFDVGNLKLNIDVVNARPNPAIDVYLTKDGKTVKSLEPIHSYTDTFTLPYEGIDYKVLPSS